MKNTMRNFVFANVLLLATACALQAANEDRQQRGQFSAKDYKFVSEAAQGSMMEVTLGELARQKGANQAVKNFGERMVSDHNKASEELHQLVSKKSAMLPAKESHKESSTISHLQRVSGKEFDRAYAEHMVSDHKKDLKEFQEAAKNSDDPELKQWAQKTLGTLQEHMRMAKEMEQAVGK